jgi:hypothetical protein
LLLAAVFPAASSNIDTDGFRESSHHFTWGADLVIFLIIIYMVASMAYARSSLVCFNRWGPTITVAVGSALLFIDPTRHVLLDHGGVICEPKYLAMYAHGGGLSFAGHLCQVASISGLILLVVGMLWHNRLPEKLYSKWAESKTI